MDGAAAQGGGASQVAPRKAISGAFPAVVDKVFRKTGTNCAGNVQDMATFTCDDHHMRALFVPLALLISVSMDITVNHGATLHGWISFLSAVVHSTGLA